MFTGEKTVDYQKKGIQERGIYEDHKEDGLNSLCSLRTGLKSLNLARKEKMTSKSNSLTQNSFRV
jgi:hypothetical protein